MVKIAFVSKNNACRSQIAECVCKQLAQENVECFSAGVVKKSKINSYAVGILEEKYNIDITLTQYPKTLEELPRVDIVIAIGDDLGGINLPHKHCETWNIEDPNRKGYYEFEHCVNEFEQKIKDLLCRINKCSDVEKI